MTCKEQKKYKRNTDNSSVAYHHDVACCCVLHSIKWRNNISFCLYILVQRV